MNISELIKMLEAIHKEQGDMPAVMFNENSYQYYKVQRVVEGMSNGIKCVMLDDH